MKSRILVVSLVFVAAIFLAQCGVAGEHGGKEHGGEAAEEQGGKEHGGEAAEEQGGKEHGGEALSVPKEITPPSAEAVRQSQRDYVAAQSADSGTFAAFDPETGGARQLEIIRVHERVGKTGDYYYTCADFKDTGTGEMLDLDLDVEQNADTGELKVVDVRIHKLEGKARYTYDGNDNRMPLS